MLLISHALTALWWGKKDSTNRGIWLQDRKEGGVQSVAMYQSMLLNITSTYHETQGNYFLSFSNLKIFIMVMKFFIYNFLCFLSNFLYSSRIKFSFESCAMLIIWFLSIS